MERKIKFENPVTKLAFSTTPVWRGAVACFSFRVSVSMNYFRLLASRIGKYNHLYLYLPCIGGIINTFVLFNHPVGLMR